MADEQDILAKTNSDQEIDRKYGHSPITPEETNKKGVARKSRKAEFVEDTTERQGPDPVVGDIQDDVDFVLAGNQTTTSNFLKRMVNANELNFKRFKPTIKRQGRMGNLLEPKEAQNVMASGITSMLQHQRTVQDAYMRKSLALQYKQTFLLSNISEMMLALGEMQESKLEAIKVNTGINASALLGDESGQEDWMSRLLKQGLDLAKERIKGRATRYTQSLAQHLYDNPRDPASVFGKIRDDYLTKVGAIDRGLSGAFSDRIGASVGRGLAAPAGVAGVAGAWLSNKISDRNKGRVKTLVNSAVPLLSDMNPEWFGISKPLSSYSDSNPLYRLSWEWRDQQLKYLKFIASHVSGRSGLDVDRSLPSTTYADYDKDAREALAEEGKTLESQTFAQKVKQGIKSVNPFNRAGDFSEENPSPQRAPKFKTTDGLYNIKNMTVNAPINIVAKDAVTVNGKTINGLGGGQPSQGGSGGYNLKPDINFSSIGDRVRRHSRNAFDYTGDTLKSSVGKAGSYLERYNLNPGELYGKFGSKASDIAAHLRNSDPEDLLKSIPGYRRGRGVFNDYTGRWEKPHNVLKRLLEQGVDITKRKDLREGLKEHYKKGANVLREAGDSTRGIYRNLRERPFNENVVNAGLWGARKTAKASLWTIPKWALKTELGLMRTGIKTGAKIGGFFIPPVIKAPFRGAGRLLGGLGRQIDPRPHDPYDHETYYDPYGNPYLGDRYHKDPYSLYSLHHIAEGLFQKKGLFGRQKAKRTYAARAAGAAGATIAGDLYEKGKAKVSERLKHHIPPELKDAMNNPLVHRGGSWFSQLLQNRLFDIAGAGVGVLAGNHVKNAFLRDGVGGAISSIFGGDQKTFGEKVATPFHWVGNTFRRVKGWFREGFGERTARRATGQAQYILVHKVIDKLVGKLEPYNSDRLIQRLTVGKVLQYLEGLKDNPEFNNFLKKNGILPDDILNMSDRVISLGLDFIAEKADAEREGLGNIFRAFKDIFEEHGGTAGIDELFRGSGYVKGQFFRNTARAGYQYARSRFGFGDNKAYKKAFRKRNGQRKREKFGDYIESLFKHFGVDPERSERFGNYAQATHAGVEEGLNTKGSFKDRVFSGLRRAATYTTRDKRSRLRKAGDWISDLGERSFMGWSQKREGNRPVFEEFLKKDAPEGTKNIIRMVMKRFILLKLANAGRGSMESILKVFEKRIPDDLKPIILNMVTPGSEAFNHLQELKELSGASYDKAIEHFINELLAGRSMREALRSAAVKFGDAHAEDYSDHVNNRKGFMGRASQWFFRKASDRFADGAMRNYKDGNFLERAYYRTHRAASHFKRGFKNGDLYQGFIRPALDHPLGRGAAFLGKGLGLSFLQDEALRYTDKHLIDRVTDKRTHSNQTAHDLVHDITNRWSGGAIGGLIGAGAGSLLGAFGKKGKLSGRLAKGGLGGLGLGGAVGSALFTIPQLYRGGKDIVHDIYRGEGHKLIDDTSREVFNAGTFLPGKYGHIARLASIAGLIGNGAYEKPSNAKQNGLNTPPTHDDDRSSYIKSALGLAGSFRSMPFLNRLGSSTLEKLKDVKGFATLNNLKNTVGNISGESGLLGKTIRGGLKVKNLLGGFALDKAGDLFRSGSDKSVDYLYNKLGLMKNKDGTYTRAYKIHRSLADGISSGITTALNGFFATKNAYAGAGAGTIDGIATTDRNFRQMRVHDALVKYNNALSKGDPKQVRRAQLELNKANANNKTELGVIYGYLGAIATSMGKTEMAQTSDGLKTIMRQKDERKRKADALRKAEQDYIDGKGPNPYEKNKDAPSTNDVKTPPQDGGSPSTNDVANDNQFGPNGIGGSLSGGSLSTLPFSPISAAAQNFGSYDPSQYQAMKIYTGPPTIGNNDVTKPDFRLPSGLRNNNPGNLKYVRQKGAMLEVARPGKTPIFAAFKTPKEGLIALRDQLNRYTSVWKPARVTVRQIIGTWSPPSENNTQWYIGTVCKTLGVKPDDKLCEPGSIINSRTMAVLMHAIVRVENGKDPYGNLIDQVASMNPTTGSLDKKDTGDQSAEISAGAPGNNDQGPSSGSETASSMSSNLGGANSGSGPNPQVSTSPTDDRNTGPTSQSTGASYPSNIEDTTSGGANSPSLASTAAGLSAVRNQDSGNAQPSSNTPSLDWITSGLPGAKNDNTPQTQTQTFVPDQATKDFYNRQTNIFGNTPGLSSDITSETRQNSPSQNPFLMKPDKLLTSNPSTDVNNLDDTGTTPSVGLPEKHFDSIIRTAKAQGVSDDAIEALSKTFASKLDELIAITQQHLQVSAVTAQNTKAPPPQPAMPDVQKGPSVKNNALYGIH